MIAVFMSSWRLCGHVRTKLVRSCWRSNALRQLAQEEEEKEKALSATGSRFARQARLITRGMVTRHPMRANKSSVGSKEVRVRSKSQRWVVAVVRASPA